MKIGDRVVIVNMEKARTSWGGDPDTLNGAFVEILEQDEDDHFQVRLLPGWEDRWAQTEFGMTREHLMHEELQERLI